MPVVLIVCVNIQVALHEQGAFFIVSQSEAN